MILIYSLQNITLFGYSWKLHRKYSNREKTIFCEFIVNSITFTAVLIDAIFYQLFFFHQITNFFLLSVCFNLNIFPKVTDSRTAHCIVNEYPRICPKESRNTGNCTSYKWNGSVQVSSATIRESLIRVSTDNVILDHMNLTDSNFSVPILIR